ncbi:hypothetical protein HZH66_007616 [Vespula vulgaris]|uniref:Uncharacterized protein n=1 Tax=Vespula vulgaris TaxID=7454 RepID=A0A834N6F7_VESVU|nr:hypothetical protein HZH66_007616 [Vespula vulgaris]
MIFDLSSSTETFRSYETLPSFPDLRHFPQTFATFEKRGIVSLAVFYDRPNCDSFSSRVKEGKSSLDGALSRTSPQMSFLLYPLYPCIIIEGRPKNTSTVWDYPNPMKSSLAQTKLLELRLHRVRICGISIDNEIIEVLCEDVEQRTVYNGRRTPPTPQKLLDVISSMDEQRSRVHEQAQKGSVF